MLTLWNTHSACSWEEEIQEKHLDTSILLGGVTHHSGCNSLGAACCSLYLLHLFPANEALILHPYLGEAASLSIPFYFILQYQAVNTNYFKKHTTSLGKRTGKLARLKTQKSLVSS